MTQYLTKCQICMHAKWSGTECTNCSSLIVKERQKSLANPNWCFDTILDKIPPMPTREEVALLIVQKHSLRKINKTVLLAHSKVMSKIKDLLESIQDSHTEINK